MQPLAIAYTVATQPTACAPRLFFVRNRHLDRLPSCRENRALTNMVGWADEAFPLHALDQ